jgi:hypothetical protein
MKAGEVSHENQNPTDWRAPKIGVNGQPVGAPDSTEIDSRPCIKCQTRICEKKYYSFPRNKYRSTARLSHRRAPAV